MVSSARNPNESYAERAKKASTSLATTQQKQEHEQPTSHVASTHPTSLKPPQVNVWAERIKEQKANAVSAVSQMPRQRATSSPQPVRDSDTIQRRSPKTDLATQLSILDQPDEHDPFVVRVPPHLSRQSSSSTNPLSVTDPAAWPHLSAADAQSNTGHDTPFLSAAPSRQNSITSFRHHAYSPSGSVRLPRVQSTISQHSHSASQSRTQSRSGSSASSPRLQIRARTLPHDDDLRLDHPYQRSSHHRSSSPLSDPPNHTSASFRVDPISPSVDPPYHRPTSIPSLQDMPPRYAQSFLPQYAFPQQFQSTHVPGHNSPTFIPPHSGQATPPYPHYPPYPGYMYGHPSLFWGDYPQSHVHLQSQPPIPSNHPDPSEHPLPHKSEFASASSAVTTESEAPPQAQNSRQRKPSKSVVFGTIGLSDPSTPATPPPVTEEQQANTVVEHVTEQFATFSIGVSPDEPGPSRLGSRKSSSRSLSRTVSAQPTTNDSAKDAKPEPLREVNGSRKPVKWEFGTTLSEDLDGSRPSVSPPPTSTSPPGSNHQNTSGPENADDRHESINAPSSPVTSRTIHSNSEAGSPTSDVWVVKDYGYGFGDYSGLGNAPEVVRREMHEREKERARDKQREREMIRDQHRDRNWVPGRLPGWRHENGVEEGRGDGWEQRGPIDVPRPTRLRRGSFPSYGGHERGGFTPRRGRAFGGRFQGGRGRGGFFHHRPGSYSYAPPPPPPPPPFEVLPPAIDIVNGYGQLPYIPPELESHEAIPPVPRSFVPNTYLVEAAQNCLLGQLEYYLSPQNLAQDFYLRQRMDDEGWIPISLLASFKRVQRFHTDADAAREMLRRSRAVEVNGNWVRMGSRQWEAFVLPNAPRSVVTGADHDGGKSPGPSAYHYADGYAEHGDVEGEHGEMEGDCDGEDCEGDDEDDDVEFVIGEEAEGSWMPVPERKQ